jgi:hypothetical protein
MTTESREGRITNLGQPIILEKDNWPQFKEAVMIYCLKAGDAGQTLRWGEEAMEEPAAPGTAYLMRSGKKKTVEVSVEDDERMVKKRHEFEEYKRRKMRLIGTILEAIGIEIRDKLMAQPKFDELVRGGDVIAVFQLVERVVQGIGTVSIFHIIIRFLNMKMTNGATTWATYFKEWKEVTVALRRQGTDREILEAIMQTQFVLSLDQDMFKDQLTSIYGSTTWPTRDYQRDYQRSRRIMM